MMHSGSFNDFISYLTQQRRNPMIDSLRPFLSRVLAPIVTAFVMWLLHFGIDLGPDASAHLTEYATVVAIALFSVLNGIIHRLIDKKVNPADAASTTVAIAGKIADKDSA